MKLTTISFLLISFIFVLTGCREDVVPPKGDEDPGILRTDEFGNILGGDSTDWCWRGASNGFSFGPAYPNPTHLPLFRIKFALPANDTVKIYFLRTATDTFYVAKDTLLAGWYTYTVNVANLGFVNSYGRLYIQCHSFTASDSCRSYGDVKFEP